MKSIRMRLANRKPYLVSPRVNRSNPKCRYELSGGPFDGYVLYLSAGSPHTGFFEVKGQQGQYYRGQWIEQ